MVNLPRPEIDEFGLLEYSVVYTDRALNHMSQKFQTALRAISATLKEVYHADYVAVIPGSGTSGMEAVVRQLAKGKKCLTIRNGFFSYRWTQILDQSQIAAETRVLTASRSGAESHSPFAPPSLDKVCAEIIEFKPDLVFAPQVETASGIMLPADYIRTLAQAVHQVGGLLVLDAIAAGCVWANMKDWGVDILISAPQKGWSGSPCCGLVMLNEAAYQQVQNSDSDSFALDLKKWLSIMQTFENGGHAYHATPPTDALFQLHQVMEEARKIGFATLQERQLELGQKIRALLAEKGFISVADQGFEAAGVVVSYTTDSHIQNGKAFAEKGMQIAAGVPLQCNEGAAFQTFRLGLFGLDKLNDIDGTVARLEDVLNQINH